MPPAATSHFRSHLTLALCVVLHTFTHAYGAMLVPLYLLMKSDLALSGVKAAALVVTVYGVVYNLGGYFAGLLADRWDRRMLLAVGLIGNAAAITGIGLSRDYDVILMLGFAAGLFGMLFHPAANALICAHYPKHLGLAIGLLGAGSGLGFFIGPQYAGWRAETAAWHWGAVSPWQKPCVELGIAGLVFGVLVIFLAKEAGTHERPPRPPLGRKLRNAVLALSAILGWRDFAGVATVSLASIYLQRACGRSVGQAGFIVGAMMLLAVVCNPLAAYLTHGRRRLPSLAGVCVVGGIILATTPLWPASLVLIPLCAFQTLQLGSYAISDSATLERVDPNVRGRIVGVFLSCAGTLAALSPWCMGFWTDRMGEAANGQSAYLAPFATLGAMMAFAALSPLVIRRFGEPGGHPIRAAQEISPATLEGVL